jgi:hypothetical protein
MIYKDVAIEDESTYGASVAGTDTQIHVISTTLGQDPTKELVEDTTGNVKGRDRINRIRNVVEGDINAYASPRTIHQMSELVWGAEASESSVGTSATEYTYRQNTDGTMLSKTMQVDRNNSQEKFSGVVGRAFELTWSDNKAEISIEAVAQARNEGLALTDILGETAAPLTFADFTVSIGSTLNYFGAGMTTFYVENLTATYRNGLESAHLSGSRNINRVDPAIPTLELNFSIFHENNGMADGAFSDGEYAMQIQAVTTDQQIVGATPYVYTWPIPRVQLTNNVRNYEQAGMAKEEISAVGLFHAGSSKLVEPTLIAEDGF